MASREINLLIKPEDYLSAVQKQQLKQVKIWVPAGLFIFLLILLGVVVTNFIVNNKDRDLNNQIATTSRAIENLTQNEGIYMILKQKVSTINKIINTRYDYLAVFDFFKTLELDNGQITQMTLARDGKTLLSFTLNDSEAMDRVVNTIINQAEYRFQSVQLISVGLGKNGGYVMELDIQV